MGDATIIVRFTQEGFHHWPDAPPERAYLSYRHRHLFHIEVSTTVTHDDRQIEFHDLRDMAMQLTNDLGAGEGEFVTMSCESMARNLASRLNNIYKRRFTISVFEDGECGATVSYP